MAWYDEAVFYHIYPLGMSGAPFENKYEAPVSRLNNLLPFLDHIKSLGCNAIYIGPLFESVGHGYETTDYKKLDSRLGTNKDLTNFVKKCHELGIRVVFDGVFNHTGRDFFAFQDIKKNREGSAYRDWYCNVNFYGNNEYNDGFSYDNWGGYNLLVKLNQRNPAVKDYIADVIRFWVSEFDVDGIRLDAADVLDFDFMKSLRYVAEQVKPEFWLMGEVIHGDYTRWVNENTLHCVTNYHLHKALYSGHNDHNFFEIAHTVKRLYGMGGNRPDGLKLYNFVDNHDVERIYTKLTNKAQFYPVHVLLYTLPGVPSIYYGSEFAIEGRKERGSDASLRPCLKYEDYKDAINTNPHTAFVSKLGKIRNALKSLSYGDYNEIMLTNRQYVYSRACGDEKTIIYANNDENEYTITIGADNENAYVGLISGKIYPNNGGNISVSLPGNSGEILVPERIKNRISLEDVSFSPVETTPAAEAIVKDNTSENEACECKANETCAEEAKVEETKVTETSADETCCECSTEECNVEETENVTEDINTVEQPVTSISQDQLDKAFHDGVIKGLQDAILARMSKNGPVTDQMRRDVEANVYYDSLINWIKSF